MKTSVTIDETKVVVTLTPENRSERRLMMAFDGVYNLEAVVSRRYTNEDPADVQLIGTQSHVPKAVAPIAGPMPEVDPNDLTRV